MLMAILLPPRVVMTTQMAHYPALTVVQGAMAMPPQLVVFQHDFELGGHGAIAAMVSYYMIEVRCVLFLRVACINNSKYLGKITLRL